MASERPENPNLSTDEHTLDIVESGMTELIGEEQAGNYASIVRNLDDETRRRHLGKMANIFEVESPLQTSAEKQSEPLHKITAAFIKRKFGDGVIGELELTDDDANGITEGLLAVHGGFSDPEKDDIAREGIGLLLRGESVQRIAEKLGLRYVYDDRILADVKLKIDTFTILSPDDARRKFDKRIVQNREERISKPETVDEMPAMAAGAESLVTLPVVTTSIEDERPKPKAVPKAIAKPQPAAPKRPRTPANAKRVKAVADIEHEQYPEIDLFDAALRNPHMSKGLFRVNVERMLVRAREAQVIEAHQQSKLQEDLLGYPIPLDPIQLPPATEKPREYRAFVSRLGSAYPGRLKDERYPNINTMRSLFTHYSKNQVDIPKLQEMAKGKVPEELVPIIIAGAISEILDAAGKSKSGRV